MEYKIPTNLIILIDSIQGLLLSKREVATFSVEANVTLALPTTETKVIEHYSNNTAVSSEILSEIKNSSSDLASAFSAYSIESVDATVSNTGISKILILFKTTINIYFFIVITTTTGTTSSTSQIPATTGKNNDNDNDDLSSTSSVYFSLSLVVILIFVALI